MKVNLVKATLKYSQDSGKGAWRTVEIGAEATVDEREQWEAALANLYADLGKELKTLWAGGVKAENGHSAPVEAAEGHNEPEPVPAAPTHYCQEHQTEFRRFERGGQVWYSHRMADGKWHNEPPEPKGS
jgi:hypothetical protein